MTGKPFDGARAAYEDGQARLDELRRQSMTAKVVRGAVLEFKGLLRAKVIDKDKTHTTLLWEGKFSPGISQTSCYRTYGLELDKNWQRVQNNSK